jgi:hypothetical protein
MKNPWLEKRENHISEFVVWETVGIVDPYARAYNEISIEIQGQSVLLITPDKFIVRGVEVEQGEGEAQKVYDAFVDFLKGTNGTRSNRI